MNEEFIQVFKPSLGEEELDALREVFASGWLGLGPKTRQFEAEFAAYCGAEHAVATNSATAALHLACVALGIGPGDEVLVPAMTFVSTAHAAAYCGATPVFVDVEPDTLNLDVADLERRMTARSRAVIPVHYGGHACRMDAIWELADTHGLAVIEDAAHACGSTYQGDHIGNARRSDAVCFSFHAVKNLPVGDGGMVTTCNAALERELMKLRWLGINKSTWDRTEEVEADVEEGALSIRRFANYGWYYDVESIGFKYHMNDIAAAIGLVQLGKLDAQNDRRREIVERYNAAFADVDWLETPVEKPYTRSACHLYAARTPHRDALNLHLKERRIATGVHYIPLHLHPIYRSGRAATLPVAENVWEQLISLPLYPSMTEEQVDLVTGAVRSFEPAATAVPDRDLRLAA